jgi:uncharacterized repeat protein (TIGR01451 family)
MNTNRLTRYSTILFGALLITSLLLTILPVNTTPIIWTDKADYNPGETATVYGSGFIPHAFYDIPMIRPDGSIVLGDGSFTPGWDTVQADSDGNFTYYYQLDGIHGTYEVRVYISPWSGSLEETPITTTTFTDPQPAANLDQGANGAADSPDSPIDYQNGNLNPNNAHFVEGNSIPYRLIMTNMPTDGTVVNLTMGYDITHSGRQALDFLTSWERCLDEPYPHIDVFGHAVETIDPLEGVTGVSGPTTKYTIPAPSSATSPVPGQPTDAFNAMSAAEKQVTLYGGTLTDIFYAIEGNHSLAQSETQITFVFTLNSSTAVLAWGGHIADRNDWGYDEDGIPRSAGGISGSPYHMRTKDWNLNNLGNQDRSLKVAAVYLPPHITVTKEPSPVKVANGGNVTYTYVVTNDGGQDLSNVTLVDDKFGTITTGVSLAVNASATYTHTATLTTIESSVTNTVNATGEGAFATVSATATATVTVIHPDIALVKSGPAKVEAGGEVTYTYNVTNTGDTSLDVVVTDDQIGFIWNGTLAAGASQIATATANLTGDSVTNTATAVGTDQTGAQVQAQDSHTVDVLNPAITWS